MAEVADFQIFHGIPQFTLEGNVTSQDIPASLPSDISPAAGGVVAFAVRNVSTTIGGQPTIFTLDLSVNGTKLQTYKLKSGTLCGLVAHWPTKGKGQLKPGANTIKFSSPVASLAESITISDVVLWFQRNI